MAKAVEEVSPVQGLIRADEILQIGLDDVEAPTGPADFVDASRQAAIEFDLAHGRLGNALPG